MPTPELADHRPWRAWPIPVGLLLAVAVLLLAGPHVRAARMTNLDVASSRFDDLFVMHHRTEPGMGYLVDRRASTVRRDKRSQQGGKRRLFTLPSQTPGEPPALVLVDKRLGTDLLVPLLEVTDWAAPLLTAAVAEQLHRADLVSVELPRLRWVNLHVDRVYRGLYLHVPLPVDKRKVDGGSGALRVLLQVVERDAALGVATPTLFRVSTLFDDDSRAYIGAVAAGVLPRLAPQSGLVDWLNQSMRTPYQTAVLRAAPPARTALYPLPVSLPDLFRRATGRLPAHVEDERAPQVVQPVQGAAIRAPSPETLSALRARISGKKAAFLDALAAAIRLDRHANARPMPDAALVASRLSSLLEQRP